MTPRMMNKLPLVIFLVLICAGEILAQTFTRQNDPGVIQEIYEDRVSVEGESGTHIFEIISPCSWCERGITVFIAFEGFSRATMTPVPNTLDSAPIKLFIVKDGREDNQ